MELTPKNAPSTSSEDTQFTPWVKSKTFAETIHREVRDMVVAYTEKSAGYKPFDILTAASGNIDLEDRLRTWFYQHAQSDDMMFSRQVRGLPGANQMISPTIMSLFICNFYKYLKKHSIPSDDFRFHTNGSTGVLALCEKPVLLFYPMPGSMTIQFDLNSVNFTIYVLANQVLETFTTPHSPAKVAERLVNHPMHGFVTANTASIPEPNLTDVDPTLLWPNHPTPHSTMLDFRLSRSRVLLLQGDPGTGKSTYILKMLDTIHWTNVFVCENEAVFLHPTFIEYVRDSIPDGSTLVIEDGDRLLEKREDGNSVMSGLLNLLSGIMVKDIYLILTLNAENLKRTDTASMRKGRLFRHMHFKPFTFDEASDLYARIGGDVTRLDRKNQYTLADIMHAEDDDVDDDVANATKATPVGFA